MKRLAQFIGLMVLMIAPTALLDCSLKREPARPAEESVRGREIM